MKTPGSFPSKKANGVSPDTSPSQLLLQAWEERNYFPPNCATICNDFQMWTYGGKCFIKGNILPPVKKTVSLQRRGLPICHLQRSLHPKRQINPDIWSSPVLPAQFRLWWISASSIACPLWKLGISHISLPKIWGRGESNQEVRFHNRSKAGECVKKGVLLIQSQRRAGASCGPITHSGCVTGTARGERPSAPCAGDCVRLCTVTWGSAGQSGGNSLRKPCPTEQCCQVHAGWIKGVLPRAEHALHSSSKGQPREAALPAALPRGWRLAVVADRLKHSPGSWQVLGLMFCKNVPNHFLDIVKMQDSCLCR